MSSSVIALLGGLIGSILTIAIGKALDLLQKRQEHKYSLQKAFFEKKLRVAESIVCNLQKTINIFEPISIILRKIPDFTAIGELPETVKAQMQSFSSQAQKIFEEAEAAFYAAPLYFDMAKLNRVSALSYEKMLNLMLMVSLLSEKTKSFTSEIVEAEQEMMKNQVLQVFGDLTVTINSLKEVMDKFICELRDEMKRFEA